MAKQPIKTPTALPPPPPPPPPIVNDEDRDEIEDDEDRDEDREQEANEELAASQPVAPVAPVPVDRPFPNPALFPVRRNAQVSARTKNIKAALLKLREVSFLPIDNPETKTANLKTLRDALKAYSDALALPAE